MKAIIIAGGLGTRLRPLTYNTPKSIVPVANRPFVLHQIELLKRYGISEIIVNLHYLSENIKRIFDDGKRLGVKLYYSIEKNPLGTAGAVKNAEEFFDEGPLVVFNGDVLTDVDIKKVLDFHKLKEAKATITLKRVDDPTTYGLVLTDKDGKVDRFIEKPSWERVTDNTINAGIYILDPAIFKEVPKGQEYSFERQLFPELLEHGEKVFGFISDAFWLDIGSPGKYMLAHRAILRKDVKVTIPGRFVKDGLWQDEGVKIAPSAKVHGPAIIGKNTKINEETEILEFTVLGEDVRVGRGSRIREAVIWGGTKIGEDVQLSHCIVGYDCIVEDNVTIGGGVVLADGTIVKKGSKLGVRL